MYSKHSSYGSVKKIKNYSYNPLDEIGKGFSSRVYKGQNDENSKFISSMATCIFQFCYDYPRGNCSNQSN